MMNTFYKYKSKHVSQPTEWSNAFFKHLLEEEWELFEGPGGHQQVEEGYNSWQNRNLKSKNRNATNSGE